MTIEERLKAVLGDMHFQIVVMAHQLEEAQKKIKELEASKVVPMKQASDG